MSRFEFTRVPSSRRVPAAACAALCFCSCGGTCDPVDCRYSCIIAKRKRAQERGGAEKVKRGRSGMINGWNFSYDSFSFCYFPFCHFPQFMSFSPVFPFLRHFLSFLFPCLFPLFFLFASFPPSFLSGIFPVLSFPVIFSTFSSSHLPLLVQNNG